MKRILLLLATMLAAVLVASGLALAAPPVTVTQSFSNPGTITINDNSTASPYPSEITVSGFGADSRIKDVNLSLNGYSHTFPLDVDVLLVAPSGKSAIVMSDAGDAFAVSDIILVLDDEADSRLPEDSALASGTYQPANYGNFADTFPSAPTPGKKASLSVFNRTDPNGTWQLYIVDEFTFGSGSISGGWTLEITAKG